MDLCGEQNLFILFISALAIASCSDKPETFTSPDNNIKVNFWMTEAKQPHYKILYRDSVVLENSKLGLVRDGIDFSRNLTLEITSNLSTVKESYKMLHGKQKEISYTATEKTFHLKHATGQELDIIFRVSNDGVAFRYHFPGESEKMHYISEEKTTFNLPDESRAWLEPLANVNTGYAQTNPSYEEHYFSDVGVGTPAPDSAGWAYPALFKVGSSWLLISETGMDGNYAATRLQSHARKGNYQVGFPQQGEEFTDKALYPQSQLPWSSPWRIITIGNLEIITESTLGTDLADPAVKMDTSWINPGRASWSWAKLKDQSITYEVQKQFIDYASEMGWEYTLVDVNWDSTIGYDRITELAEHAAAKKVGLFLWYNSSGSWNTTIYSPKNQLLTHEDRVEEFSKLKEMGIKGIKVDFFAGDGQSMIQYYLDIFKDAAEYNLLVNTHGSTLPRGWHRTWPNLMTMESVKGFEFVTFEQINANRQASHCTILPFTRNVFSPMDFTPMSLTELFNVERKTSSTFELALPVLFTSGIQHYAETAQGMEEVPGYVQDIIKKIPVSWDEMKFIDGYPGKLAIIARRKGGKWFVAGINGENDPKTVTIDLSFLPERMKGQLVEEGETPLSFSHSTISSSLDSIDISMNGNGGFVMLFEKKEAKNKF